jgi:hypothetical protein
MVFQGYMALGGTEIINQARTTSYTRHALPRLDLRECDGCDDFHEVVGDAPYESPMVDRPDWYDEDIVDSWDFYGLYPLTMDGFDDGTSQVTITEMMTDGSAVSVPRRASRQMRVTGLLVGRTDAAISYGMVWLRNALLGNACSAQLSCTGDHLCFFTACPPVCEDSPSFPTTEDTWRGCEDGVVLDPISQCTAPYERILYDVTLVDGPRVVEQYPSGCANYVRVEFTLVAATPSPVGIARRAISPTDLPSTDPVLIPETHCNAEGDVNGRRNMMLSPKVLSETHSGTWLWGAQIGAKYKIDVEVTPPVDTGDLPASMSDEVLDDVGTTVMSQLDDVGIWRHHLSDAVGPLPASPGIDVTASVYVRTSKTAQAMLWFDYLSETGRLLGQSDVGVADLLPNTWGRVSVTLNAPSTAVYLVGHASTEAAGTEALPGDMTWWAAALLEHGQVPLTYFDGDTTDTELMRYRWGTERNQSTSWAARIASNALVIRDPDCARIPDPPRAPMIVDSCVQEVVQWRRYQYAVDADLVPLWSDALPYLTIQAGKFAIRQVRVRFYPTPLGLGLADLEPCNFCGEFVVAYIPPNSVLTVDGIRRQAFITSPGGVMRVASHLLYSSDGGPMQWSALTCGIAYTMTVDLAPAKPVPLSSGGNEPMAPGPGTSGVTTTLCLAARE